jgi:hypothetical protein
VCHTQQQLKENSRVDSGLVGIIWQIKILLTEVTSVEFAFMHFKGKEYLHVVN